MFHLSINKRRVIPRMSAGRAQPAWTVFPPRAPHTDFFCGCLNLFITDPVPAIKTGLLQQEKRKCGNHSIVLHRYSFNFCIILTAAASYHYCSCFCAFSVALAILHLGTNTTISPYFVRNSLKAALNAPSSFTSSSSSSNVCFWQKAL